MKIDFFSLLPSFLMSREMYTSEGIREKYRKDKEDFERRNVGKQLETLQCAQCHGYYYIFCTLGADEGFPPDCIAMSCNISRNEHSKKIQITFGFGSYFDYKAMEFTTDKNNNYIDKQICDICVQDWIDDGTLVLI